jgi:YaaC-like Protein
VTVTPALPALSGGPRLTGGTLADLARPSKEVVWRHLRLLRHQPPGRASGGERRRVFGAALEQAQQLFAAAASVDHASQPILLFYGLSQAGRAIAACTTTAGNNDWRLTGHGIEVPNLDQRPELPDLAIANKRKGSFTQLAPLLHSGSLPAGVSLGQIWLTIPDLANPLLGKVANYLPTLRLAHLSEDGRPEFSSWIEGMPWRFAGPYTEAEFVEFCNSYPTLAGSVGRPVTSQPPLLDEERQSVQVRRAWTLPESDDPGKFHSRHTRPYLGDDDRYIFPSIGGDQQALHPLLAWWAVLFALSMLARYQPDTWTAYVDVDKSPYAVTLEALLDRALVTCPQLFLHAIRSVST